jgi:hypothetical protein
MADKCTPAARERGIIRGAMEKKYYVEVYNFTCPNPRCGKNVLGTAHFAVYDLKEATEARRTGLLKYKCTGCGKRHSGAALRVNGEFNVVSQEEALKKGLDWESKGSA